MDSPASSSNQSLTATHHVKGDRKPIKLSSPYNGSSLQFQWQKEYETNGAMDIYDTMRMIFGLIPEIKEKVDKIELLRDSNITNYDWIRTVSKKFNKFASAYFKEHSKNGDPIKEDYASADLLRTICTRAYNRAVDDEKKLNRHYEAFSSQTYGETSYDRLRSIIEEVEITDQDIFVDLGSGVGQLVVQMAGGSKVKKAFGIEIADLPSGFAKKLEIEFKSIMKWFGRKYRPFQIHHGDFLEEKYRSTIVNEATIIFINNYAFTADLESNIKSKLLSDLKHGTRIISTKPYAPANKKSQISERSLGDLSSILDVTQLKKIPNPCSWTSNDVPYYLHVINRVKLEQFFEIKKNPQLRLERSGTPSSNSSSMSREESRASSRNGAVKDKNGDLYGPTTRRKWNQIINESKTTTKNGSETPNENSGVHSEPEFRSPTPVVDAAKTRDANIADIIASVAGGTAQTVKEFAAPAKKRPRKDTLDGKVTVRGRPRKNAQPQEKKARISQEAREGMDIMHQLTSEACSKAAEMFADSAFVLTDVTNPVSSILNELEDNGNQEYPNLDRFITELRSLYIKFLDSFNTEEFYQSLKARREKAKLEAQHQEITKEGVSMFKSTLKSYGMDLEKQRDKLSSAKRFITRYNGVLGLVHNLEKEIAALDEDSKSLIMNYSRECAEEINQSSSSVQPVIQPPQQPIAAVNPKVEEFSQPLPGNSVAMALQQSLRNFPQSLGSNDTPLDQLLINNIAQTLTQNPMLNSPMFSNPGLLQPLNTETASMPQQSQPSSNILSSYLNITPELLNIIKNGGLNSVALSEASNSLNFQQNAQLYNHDTSRASTTAPVAPTPSEIPASSTTAMPSNVSAIIVQPLQNMPSTSKEQPQAPLDPVVINGTATVAPASSSSSSSKKPRTRSIRIPSNKKTVPPKNVDDPAKEEEIESKVKNFVQIALEVDKTAKSNAEKDRKVRTSEKRSKDKISGTQPEQMQFEAIKSVSTEEPSSKKSGSRKNKTYPGINMNSSPTGHSKKRLSTDTSSLPSSSMASIPSTTIAPSSALPRPIIVSSNSMSAASPFYQQQLTPTATVASSSNTVFPSMDTSQADFLNLLSQNVLKDGDPMQMLMRNMNGGNNLMNLLSGLNGFPSVVSSASATAAAAAVVASNAMVNNNPQDILNYLSALQRNGQLPQTLGENPTSMNSQQSDCGQF